MYFSSFDNYGFDDRYLGARKNIDILCDEIVAGRIRTADAREEYQIIELKYMRENVEGIRLFRMIYKNRIDRLCRQFQGEDYDTF